MKFDLALDHSGIARHHGQAAAPAKRVSAVLRRAKEWLFAEWHPLSDEEAYLAQAQNGADLERRLMILQDPRTRQSFW